MSRAFSSLFDVRSLITTQNQGQGRAKLRCVRKGFVIIPTPTLRRVVSGAPASRLDPSRRRYLLKSSSSPGVAEKSGAVSRSRFVAGGVDTAAASRLKSRPVETLRGGNRKWEPEVRTTRRSASRISGPGLIHTHALALCVLRPSISSNGCCDQPRGVCHYCLGCNPGEP